MTRTLVLGGIRSGKSALAEARVSEYSAATGQPVVYVATGEAGDPEMARRIRRHQQRRPGDWGLVEEPLAIARTLENPGRRGACLLIDCMSLWVSNLLHTGDTTLERETDAFLVALERRADPVVVVSNEVGLGTIGMDPLTRRYCDELGQLNQALAARCDHVVLCIAGLPQRLKGPADTHR